MRYSCALLANPLGGIHRLMAGPSTMTATLKMATRAVRDKASEPQANPANTTTATISASRPATDVTVARAPWAMLS